MRIINCLFPIVLLTTSQACKDSCVGCTPPPPSAVISVPIFYVTNTNVDLLDQAASASFKKNDIKVTTSVEQNGSAKELDPNEVPLSIDYDNSLQKHFFYLLVPTNYQKNPIRTIIRLSTTVTDTVTYTFLSKSRPYVPDKLFYNKKMVWDVANAPVEGAWPPITIVK